MLINNSEYLDIISNIKEKIKNAQYRAVISANKEMILLYWNIGNIIVANSNWGNKFIENLARDIKSEFPDAAGYSVRNLKYMKKLALTYQDYEFVQQAVAQIPWGHNIAVLDKTDNYETKKWYIYACIENGWSRNILVMQIESRLYERQVLSEKTTNFKERLPAPQSDLVVQTLKDPYIFDFIEFKEGMIEREVEQEMVNNISKLLLELGTGFAFIGNQYHISVGGQDFYIDLLFYNTKLHCYVVIELKNEEFKPEYAGKVNFYLSAVDDLLKTERDNSSVGIILCREKNKLVVEYALRQITSPIGVSEYCLSEHLPKELENILPSAEDIEKRIRLKYSVDNTEREDAENDE